MSSHAEIAAALIDIYEFLVKIGYLNRSEVNWPPHTRNPLPEDKCREYGLSESAINLLRLLPWLHTDDEVMFMCESHLLDFGEEQSIKLCRDIQNYMPHEREIKTLPSHQFFLTAGYDEWTMFLIVDADSGKIRQWFEPESEVDDVEDDCDGADVLKEILDEFASLRSIPIRGKGFSVQGDKKTYGRIKNMLVDYGWPDNFRREDFRRDVSGAKERWLREENNAKLRLEHPELKTQEDIDEYRKKEVEAVMWQVMPAARREQLLSEAASELKVKEGEAPSQASK